MVEWADARRANTGPRVQDYPVVAQSDRRVTTGHPVSDDMMGDRRTDGFDRIGIVDGDQQFEHVALKQGGQREQCHGIQPFDPLVDPFSAHAYPSAS